MIEAFLSTFLIIGALELADKTRIVALVLTTRFNAPLQIFFGMTLAYAIVDGVAILFANAIATLLPLQILRHVVGILFIIFGVITLFVKFKEEEERKIGKGLPFTIAFLASLSEFGDKTQIATGLLAIKYKLPLLVFLGTMSSLAVLNIIYIFLGKKLVKIIPFNKVKKISAIVFILFGAASIFLQ